MAAQSEYRLGQAGCRGIDPLNTMLPLEELNKLDTLSGSTLYSAELKRLPLLSREQLLMSSTFPAYRL